MDLFLKVPATGGESVAVTRLETGQSAHEFPQFLPDGHHFIYFVKGRTAQGVYVGFPRWRFVQADRERGCISNGVLFGLPALPETDNLVCSSLRLQETRILRQPIYCGRTGGFQRSNTSGRIFRSLGDYGLPDEARQALPGN